MKIGFTYNIKAPETAKTDIHAEYETQETIETISQSLGRFGTVIHLPCDSTFLDRIMAARPDVVFNIAEGWGGRDRESFVPIVCTMLGIPHTGSDAVALGVTMDKALTKRLLGEAGVRTTPFSVYEHPPESPPDFGFPAFVKPNCDGSSRGISAGSLVDSLASLARRVETITTAYNDTALVEPYLGGGDYCVALLGNGTPRLLPTCEVLLGHVDDIPFFSWEYKQCDTDRLDMSPTIGDAAIAEMEKMALTSWKVLGLKDYARIDFRTDSDGIPYLLEINALPGLSPVSGIFIQQAKEAGMGFDDIIGTIFARVLSGVNVESAACREQGVSFR